jgi:hypothetical protein
MPRAYGDPIFASKPDQRVWNLALLGQLLQKAVLANSLSRLFKDCTLLERSIARLKVSDKDEFTC